MTTTDIPGRTSTAARGAADVELILSQIDSLPTLPAVAARLLELTMDERSSVREAVALIESDQSLAARVLSVIRRASCGATADTVERAVVLLGLDAVRSLVLSIQIFETFSHRVERDNTRFDRSGFWKHSLAVGCAAQELAAAPARRDARHGNGRTGPKPEEAFLCGLLHDVGKVVLDACFPKSYDRAVCRAEAAQGGITDAEREVFGLDHTVAGRRLATRWKLPTMVQECIWLHHHEPDSTPRQIDHPEYVRLIQLADRIVRQMRIGYSDHHGVETPAAELAVTMGLSRDVVDAVGMKLPELLEARASLIGLDRLSSSRIYQEALRDANAELAKVNLSLAETNRGLEGRARCFEALRALNAGLGDEPMHEDVCRAAVEAAACMLPDRGRAVFGVSGRRGVLALAAASPEAEPAVQILPAPEADALEPAARKREDWQPMSVLPTDVRDRVASALGEPVRWWWPVRHQGRLIGGLVLTGDAVLDAEESFEALSAAVAVWLSAAEARAASRSLNEDLAEMNRHLVASRAEVARMRSLAMVGEMAAGAAHELNNPLAVISGRAQMLTRENADEQAPRAGQVIERAAVRASEIVLELMAFAKPTPPAPTTWPLAGLWGDIRRDWLERKHLTPEQFRLELSDDLPEVRADAAQIRMLFDEVIRNAVEAMRGVAEPSLLVNCRGDLTDDRLVIRIQDNGCGMAEDVLERAMDPFFSHRPAGRGRGLGLSRAARYADINGGRIRLSSRVNEGTVVRVELPAAAGE